MLQHLVAAASPDAEALVTMHGERMTYGELRRGVQRAADLLRAALNEPAGRIVGVSINDPAIALIAMLAVLEAGAVLWPLDGRISAAGRAELIARAQPAAVIAGGTLAGDLSLTDLALDARRVAPEAGMLLFTSGSSGVPKGVLLGRAGIIANVDAILAYLPVAKNSRTALVLPLTYSYAIVGQAFVTLRAGGTLLLLADIAYPIRQIEAMVAEGANGLSSVPTSLRRLCQAAAGLPPDQRPDLGYLASAGAPLDGLTLDAMRATFPEARLFNQYGMTEACPRVCAIDSTESPFARGSVGRPLLGITVHAVGEDGARLPAGEIGELVVLGPSLMLGYLDDPEGSRQVLGADGLRSGDLGWIDPAGYVYVSGRRDGLVNCGGERVSVEEVAAVVRRAPGVSDAYVVALPDDLLGARLVAFIEVAEGDDVTLAVRRVLRDYLPPAKRPQRIIQLPSLPRTGSGKVEMTALKRMAADTPDPSERRTP